MESVAYEMVPRENNTSSELLYGGQADKAPASFGAPSCQILSHRAHTASYILHGPKPVGFP